MENTIIVTDAAYARIAKILSNEPANSKLRISVQGGGCSGFQYHFDFDNTEPKNGDIIISKDDAIVIIDDLSIGFISGSTLDYVETLGSAGFEIKNPHATAKCGCGNSFAV